MLLKKVFTCTCPICACENAPLITHSIELCRMNTNILVEFTTWFIFFAKIHDQYVYVYDCERQKVICRLSICSGEQKSFFSPASTVLLSTRLQRLHFIYCLCTFLCAESSVNWKTPGHKCNNKTEKQCWDYVRVQAKVLKKTIFLSDYFKFIY